MLRGGSAVQLRICSLGRRRRSRDSSRLAVACLGLQTRMDYSSTTIVPLVPVVDRLFTLVATLRKRPSACAFGLYHDSTLHLPPMRSHRLHHRRLHLRL